MEKIIVGIADDQERIHKTLEEFVVNENKTIELVHFFDVQGLLEFLDNRPEFLDMLFLDIVFEGSMSGTDGVPLIKELSPELPIIMLTGNDLNNPMVDEYIREKQINDYMEKPVSKKVFFNKIYSMKNISEDLSVIDELAEEYQLEINKITDELNIMAMKLTKAEETKDVVAGSNISKQIWEVVGKVFPNLEFRNRVLVEILGKNYDSRVIELLKKLNDNIALGNGEKGQLFREFGVEDLYEYRISQKARLFVQRRPSERLLVYEIDYNHNKH